MTDSAADAARQAFAARLRDLRKDARLNGRDLAAATGMSPPKVSRIERARQNASEDDIRAWAIACGAALQIPELIAAHREVEQMWTEHRRAMKAGLVHIQGQDKDLYAQTKLLQAYESNVVPGILHTYRYAASALATAAHVHGRPVEEAEPAAAAKLERQRLITSPTGANRYSFVIEAGALDHGFGGFEVMREQFDFLDSVTRLPHVILGIIPPLPGRRIRPGEGFYIFDDRLVRSETWTGTLATRRRDQITYYLRVFGLLREMAVYGGQARALIDEARTRITEI